MSSYVDGGIIKFKPIIDEEDQEDGGYPFKVPEIMIEGYFEEFYPQTAFSWNKESVISKKDNKIIEYAVSTFTELHAQDENGNLVWIDGRKAPYSDSWGGKYLDDFRDGTEYQITVYNLESLTKKIYNGIFDSEETMNDSEMERFGVKKEADPNDLESLIEVIKKDINKYKELPNKYKDDIEFHHKLIDKCYSVHFIYSASDIIKDNKELIMKAIEKDPGIYKSISNRLKNDQEIILKSLSKDERLLEYVPEQYKKDKLLIKNIFQTGTCLKFADEELKKDKELILTLAKKNSDVFKFIDKSLQDDIDVATTCLQYSSVCDSDFPFSHLSDRLKDNAEFMKKAVYKNAYLLKFASDKLKDNKELVMEALRSDVKAIEYASERLQSDDEIIDLLIKRNVEIFRFVKNKETFIKLVKKDKDLFKYVPHPFNNDNDIRELAGLEKIDNKQASDFDDMLF